MREVITMWRDTRMIMLVAVTAAVYAAILIPFKGLTIIPGFTSVRPANVFPVIFSVMFGPAAAWGSAIGNLIGDIFGGTFGPGSIGGFVGNFFFGFVGYKLWGNLGVLSSGQEPDFREDVGKQLLEYAVVVVTASTITAAIIAWWVEVLGIFPFSVFGIIISVNNLLAAIILGPPLLYLMYPRVKEMNLLYWDVMRPEEMADADPSRRQIAAYGLAATSVLWVVIGVAYSLGVQGVEFGAIPGVDAAPGSGGATFQIILGAVAFLVILAMSAISGDSLPELARRTSGVGSTSGIDRTSEATSGPADNVDKDE